MNGLSKMVALSTLVVGMAGCASTFDPNVGADLRHNQQMQVVDYTAGTESEPVAYLDGVKAKQVMDSYQREKSKAPTGTIINVGR